MAKTTRLKATDITGTNGVGYDFEIRSDVGSLTTANPIHEITVLPSGGVVLSQDSGDQFEPFTPIVSSSLDLTFFATHDDQLTDIVSMNRAGEKGTYVKLRMWKNGAVEEFWYGVLVPEETTYEITDGRTLVRMKFADGLKMLGAEELRDNSDGVYSGWNTSLDYVNAILRKIPWVEDMSSVEKLIRETPFLELKDWSDAAGYVSSDMGMLRKTGFIGTTYAGEKENKGDGRLVTFSEAQDCLTVLEDICLNFGYKLAWNGECFHFFSPLNYTDDAQGQASHASITYTKLQAGNQTGTVDSFAPHWNSDTYAELANGATRVFSNSYNEAIVTHTGNIGSNIIGPQSGLSIEGTSSNPSFGNDSGSGVNVTGYQIDSGSQLTLRVAGTLQMRDNQNHRGYQWFAKCILKVGNYYLSGGVDMDLKDLDNGSEFPCLHKDSPSLYWTTSAASVYVPYISGYSYATPSADEHGDGLHFLPSLFASDGQSPASYSYDEGKRLVRINYTLVTPELPSNLTGINFTHSVEAHREDSGSIQVYHNGGSGPNYGSDFFTDAALDYVQQTCFLYEGTQSDDPIYSTKHSSDVFNEVVDLGDTNLGARLNRSGNNGYISAQLEAGGYSFSSQYASQVDLSVGYANNLQLIIDEWYRFAGIGMEGLDASFVLKHDAPQSFFPWADKAVSSTCVLGGSQVGYFIPSSATYDVSGDIDFTGLLIDRDGGVVIVDNGRPVPDTGRPNPPTIDGRRVSGGGGGGVSTGDLQDSKDETDLLAIFISRNNI